HPLLSRPATDPTSLYRARDGLMAIDLLAAAVAHLDLFSILANGPMSLDALCAKLEIHQRPADVMMTLAAAMELVTRKEDQFELTPLAREHLVSSSPFSLIPYFAAMK